MDRILSPSLSDRFIGLRKYCQASWINSGTSLIERINSTSGSGHDQRDSEIKSPPLHEAYITLSGFDDILIKPSECILAILSMRCTITPIQLLTGSPELCNGSMLLEL
jgi:hypothetical protein